MKGRVAALAIAFGGCCLATISQGAWRFDSSDRPQHVTAVVRNDLGQFKWIATEATDYTPLEAAGRRVYMRGGCYFCHSQYDRPVSGDNSRPWGPVSADTRRWGPMTEAGEYAFDAPRFFGPGGIGPDLSREGMKYSDEWHLAHFWNPPMVTKGSIMGGFSGLFETPRGSVKIVDDAPSGRTLEQTAETKRFFDFASKDQVKLTPNEQGLLFVPMSARGKHPVVWTPNNEFAGDTLKLVAETKDVVALTAYIQKLGMNRGQWRDLVTPEETDGFKINMPRSDEWIAHGKEVFERRCIACHGAKGDGNGWAATFLYRQRPRNFTFGEFKFRLTKGPLPTDGDLLRTITRGVGGTAMPAWFELPLDDRLAVMQYIKYVLAVDKTTDPANPEYFFVSEAIGPPLSIGLPPTPSPDLVAHGNKIWLQAKCWECHGKTGRGDGQKAAGLKDDWGFPIHPANLTLGQFKSGPAVTDIFRTISTGLTGTPMPSFRDAFVETDRWALAYYILSLSAFTDPLTGKPLPIGAADRAALDDPRLSTADPDHAYRPQQPLRIQ